MGTPSALARSRRGGISSFFWLRKKGQRHEEAQRYGDRLNLLSTSGLTFTFACPKEK
jgi:hypothetical protein